MRAGAEMADDRNSILGVPSLQYRRRPRPPAHPNRGFPRRLLVLTLSDPLTWLSLTITWVSFFSYVLDAKVAVGSLRIPTSAIIETLVTAAVLLCVIPACRAFQWYRYAVAVTGSVVRMGAGYTCTVQYALDDITFHGTVRLPEMHAWTISPGDSLDLIVNAKRPESPKYDPELERDVQRG